MPKAHLSITPHLPLQEGKQTGHEDKSRVRTETLVGNPLVLCVPGKLWARPSSGRQAWRGEGAGLPRSGAGASMGTVGRQPWEDVGECPWGAGWAGVPTYVQGGHGAVMRALGGHGRPCWPSWEFVFSCKMGPWDTLEGCLAKGWATEEGEGRSGCRKPRPGVGRQRGACGASLRLVGGPDPRLPGGGAPLPPVSARSVPGALHCCGVGASCPWTWA